MGAESFVILMAPSLQNVSRIYCFTSYKGAKTVCEASW